MSIGDIDYYGDLNAPPEPEWMLELPELDEAWHESYRAETFAPLEFVERCLQELRLRDYTAA